MNSHVLSDIKNYFESNPSAKLDSIEFYFPATKSAGKLEVWRDVKGYRNLYMVSNLGRVRSLTRVYHNEFGQLCVSHGKIIKQRLNRFGYLDVGLHKRGKRRMFYVHRLVAAAFIPNPHHYPQINHKDEDKTNNHVDNLEWCTSEMNCNYGHRNERISKGLSRYYRTHPMHNSRPIVEFEDDGTPREVFPSIAAAVRATGIGKNSIKHKAKTGEPDRHGYFWMFVGKEGTQL